MFSFLEIAFFFFWCPGQVALLAPVKKHMGVNKVEKATQTKTKEKKDFPLIPESWLLLNESGRTHGKGLDASRIRFRAWSNAQQGRTACQGTISV